MLYEKLQASGITEALTALGYDCEKIFGGLSKEAEELYASYSWRKIPCSVEGIRLAYVVHAVPPAELLEKNYPWEEWFFQFEKPEHHVLFLSRKGCCDQEIFIPADDKDHPEEACGKTWYYFGDKEIYPYFRSAEK